ncbi:MAG: hypothetical protein BGO98_26100 [Myxococcales bacterium 68-20]|nr:MAG: hypothetical protein BGO98_26100 [Myxococcales bacterium 68-20]
MSRAVRSLACLGSLAIFLHLSVAEAHACSMALTIPSSGALVGTAGGFVETPELPRNVAFIFYGPEAPPTLDVARAADGTLVQARLSRELPLGTQSSMFLYTLDAPLPTGARFKELLAWRSFEIGNELLDSPPPPTELRAAEVRHSDDNDGCFRQDSCGAMTTLDLDHPEEPGAVFYGVYYGDSPEEVAAATAPTEITTVTYLHVEETLRYGARFVAVTVFDRAGHESAKSKTIRIVNEGEEGCSAAPHSSGVFQGYVLMLAAAALTRIRRLRVRHGD